MTHLSTPHQHAADERTTLLVDELRRRLGPGVRLAPEERATYQGVLGADLSGMLVHRSPLAAGLAYALEAEAFTVGQHVLGGSALGDGTPAGTALLGHEAAHSIQRDADGSAQGEDRAQSLEQLIQMALNAPPSGEEAPLDPEVVADRVYRLMKDTLVRERERGGWGA